MPRRLDPIIEELHDIRCEIAKRFEGDVHRISEDARQRQAQEGRPEWHPKPAVQAAQHTRDSVDRHG
jgi:hypothetical protein